MVKVNAIDYVYVGRVMGTERHHVCDDTVKGTGSAFVDDLKHIQHIDTKAAVTQAPVWYVKRPR